MKLSDYQVHTVSWTLLRWPGVKWRDSKRYINFVMDIVIAWYLFRFTLTEVKELVYRGFEVVTPERWQSLIKLVQEKIEDHYWEQDGLHEELLEWFLIHISSDSSDSEDGDGCDGGINDSSSTSNSESESFFIWCKIVLIFAIVVLQLVYCSPGVSGWLGLNSANNTNRWSVSLFTFKIAVTVLC